MTTLLEGSVRRIGPRVRVTARLVGEDGYEVWSGTFDRVLEDVFAIQEEIGHAVAAALEVQLSSAEARRLERPGTRNTRALEKYLKARHLEIHEPKLARELLREAISTDARFAEAHAALADADVHLLTWHLLDDERERLRREALAASEEALRLDPALAEAHVSRANLLMLEGRSAEADEEFRRATALNPGLAAAWRYHGRFLITQGRFEEAATALEEATRHDPEDYTAVILLPQVYRSLGDLAQEASSLERALEVTERWLRLNPDDVRAHHVLGGFHLRRAERARGEALLARALELKPENPGVLYDCACAYALIGETDRALDLLERAVAAGRGFRGWYESDSDLDAIREHPRFREIMARVPR